VIEIEVFRGSGLVCPEHIILAPNLSFSARDKRMSHLLDRYYQLLFSTAYGEDVRS
jgi:hypothetical protein